MVLLWIVVAIAGVAAELHLNSLHALHEAAAALAVAVLAIVWPSVLAQIAVFGLLSWVLLALVRPRVVQRLLRVTPRPTQPFPDVAEREAVVRQRVTDHAGLVEVGRGEYWTARAYPPGASYEPGMRVVVAYRMGLRLFVEQAPPHR